MIQQITIKGIEQSQTKTGNTKITLKDDTHKYSFYKNKKDGGFSKAYEQWKDLQNNPVVSAEVKSEEQTFTNAQGKVIKYMSNMIMYFMNDQTQQDAQNSPTPMQNTSTPTLYTSTPVRVPGVVFSQEKTQNNSILELKQQINQIIISTTNNFVLITQAIKKLQGDVQSLKCLNVKTEEEKADPSAFELHSEPVKDGIKEEEIEII